MKYGVAIVMVGWSCLLFGQQLNVSVNQIHELKELSVDNHIKCLSKDRAGNLWVGADNGLYRFNGKDLDRVDIPYVKDILLTQEGKLYVLSDAGLFEIETSDFKWQVQHLVPSQENPTDSTLSYPKTIYQDIAGNIWIGENQSLICYRYGNMQRFPVAEQNVGNYLRHSFTFTEDGFGTLWALAFSGSLYRYDQVVDQFIQVPLPADLKEASELASDGARKLWIGTIDGIFEASVEEKNKISEMQRISDLGQIASMSLQDGKAWVASFEKGLYQFDITNYESLQLSTFENVDILDIFHEANQVWIAGSESIFVINAAPFSTFPETLNQFVPTFQQVQGHSYILNLGRQCFQVRRTPSGMQFDRLIELGDELWANDATLYQEELWMATSQGVYVVDVDQKELTLIKDTDNNSWLNTVFSSSNGVIWVSNQKNEALIKVDPQRQIYTFPEYSKVRFVKEDGVQTYLAGEEGTFVIYTEERGFQSVSLPFAFSPPNILDLAFSQDSIFLATEKGIFVLNKSELNQGDPFLRPLTSTATESIAINRDGAIWFSHPKGLSKWEKGEQVTFDRSQGLPSKYIITRGLLIDSYNQLWVCTSKGLATMRDGALEAFETPKPRIISCNSNNRDIEIKDFELGSFFYNHALGLEFLSMVYPRNSIQYQVRLMLEGEMVEQHLTDGFLTFFGLQTGSYTLEIQAKQTGSKWSEPVDYTFSITKKWYQQTWFRILIGSGFLALGYLLFWLYNRNLRQINEKLEKLVKERTASLEAQKNELLQTQKQIVAQQQELISKNEVLSETQKALTHSEIQFLELKRDQMRRELDLKAKQLTTHALSILQKNQYLLEISESLDVLGSNKKEKEVSKEVKRISQHIRNSIKQSERWEEFRLYFEQVHDDFYAKLKLSYPKLTNQDLKQCALVKLNLSLEDSATILGVSSESVRISRYRIQKKMGMSSQGAFYEYLVKL